MDRITYRLPYLLVILSRAVASVKFNDSFLEQVRELTMIGE
jgi:hypothetical protein